MISLAAGPYLPLHHGVAATGDWRVVVALLVVMAIAFGALSMIGYRSTRPQPARKHEPREGDRKAA